MRPGRGEVEEAKKNSKTVVNVQVRNPRSLTEGARIMLVEEWEPASM